MAELELALAKLWDAHRGEIDARVSAIEAALPPIGEATTDGAARDEARRAAHQLAGTCGTFGFAQASRHAAAIEEGLTGAPGETSAAELAQMVTALRAALPETETTGRSTP
jgi:HPt (histidine-containing phosphotransfer) domain-containing protein